MRHGLASIIVVAALVGCFCLSGAFADEDIVPLSKLAATGPEANTGDDLAVMQKGAHDDGRG